MLEIAFILFVLSLVNCFQVAAGILAMHSGKSFWRWFWISLFLPIISMIILVALWDDGEVKKMRLAEESEVKIRNS